MSHQRYKENDACCEHGGKRPGCGRKPGIKTEAIRLPKWLLDQLREQGNARQLIVDACTHQYQLGETKASVSDD